MTVPISCSAAAVAIIASPESALKLPLNYEVHSTVTSLTIVGNAGRKQIRLAHRSLGCIHDSRL
jgi:hypothetical protein